MTFFKSNPFVWLLLPFLIGIGIQPYINIPHHFLFIGSILFILLEISLHLLKSNYKTGRYFGAGITGFILLTALFITSKTKQSDDNFFNSKHQIIQATTLNIPKETKNAYSIPLHIKAIKINNKWRKQDFTIQTYFEKDSILPTVEAGQNIAIKIKIDSLQNNRNPFGFDYKDYLAFNNINHTAFIKKTEWISLDQETGNLKSFALNYRQRIIHQYENMGISGDELAVFSALTIGYKDKLESQLKEAYAGAGAMHILAVSGMHVAIILGILNFIFKYLPVLKRRKRLTYFIILASIWAYAFITGLSPSITRASIMVSFVLIGKIIGKRISIYNSLAAAAFFMLCYNPNYIYQVGFQLSFIAVLSIVIFYKKIYNLIYCKNWIVNYLWQLTAVSIAAQIGTLPLGIYYFHQLPTYFWLSGAFTVFAAQALMILAIIAILIASIGLQIPFLGKGITIITKSLNTVISTIYNLPFSTLTFYDHHLVQIILMFAFIMTAWIFLTTKKQPWIFAALTTLLLMTTINSIYKVFAENNNTVAVYQIKNNTAIHLIHKSTSLWIIDDSTQTQLKRLKKDASNYWHIPSNKCNEISVHNINNSNTKGIYVSNNFFKVGSNIGYIINENSKLPLVIDEKIAINYLIIAQNPSYSITDVNKVFKYDKIIIDGSVSRWQLKKWMLPNVNSHAVSKVGAFVHAFN